MPHSPSPLLATKLFVPRPRQSLVMRPQLAQRLDQALAHPLTLVSAPAGFGKTTLVSSWASEQSMAVAWLSLDDADNDPARFMRYLAAALQSANAAVGQALCALPAAAQPPIEAAITDLINDLAASPTELLLVLDDLHLIDNPQVEETLRTLVAHQPPQLHLLLITREDPPLPLARLRGSGHLVEVRAQDLRFSLEEAAAFLNQVMGLALTPVQIQELDVRIEGWVAGLQLAALSLQQSDDPAVLIDGLSSSHHFILSYLTEEVLRRQPPEMQTFLLQTSVLNRLHGPLCDAVTGRTDSSDLLEQLYTANAFVVALDAEHRWFRYHHLFGELLRSQLQSRRPQAVPGLLRQAAQWCAAQDLPADAIDYALAAADYSYVVALLEQHARPLVLQGYAASVAGWLQQLPEAWRSAGPQANLAFAWSLLLRGQLGEIDRYLHNVEVSMAGDSTVENDARSSPVQAGLRAELLALRAGLVSLRGDTALGCDLAQKAVELAAAGDLYSQGMSRFCLATACNYAGRTLEAVAGYQAALPLCRATGNSVAAMLSVANLAMLTIDRGQLHAAAEICRQAIAEAGRTGASQLPAPASVYGAHAHLLYEWNELTAAYLEAQKALMLARRSGHVASIAYGNVVLARIQQARGDLDAAASALDQSLQLRGRGMPAWVAPYIVAQQVQLALAQDDEAAAAQALAQSGRQMEDAIDHTGEVVHLAYLRFLLHQLQTAAPGRAQTAAPAALRLAGRLLASAEPAGRLGRVIEILCLRALVRQTQSEHSAAGQDLASALALAAPEAYVRTFVDLGEPMARLLARTEQTQQQAYHERLLAHFAVEPAAPRTATRAPVEPAGETLIEDLSERELEVLRLMAGGLTYQAVADQLIVSLNTVRFHVKSIYGKLAVANRTAALERARTLGLL